jgi:acetolactate synthase regulatory subunit
MATLHPQYFTDTAGIKMAVLPAKELHSLIEQLEELHDISLVDFAAQSNEQAIPMDEAFSMIEEKRSNNSK